MQLALIIIIPTYHPAKHHFTGAQSFISIIIIIIVMIKIKLNSQKVKLSVTVTNNSPACMYKIYKAFFVLEGKASVLVSGRGC